MNSIKPKLLVFDLDYTLWPFWVDTHFSPPFTKNFDGSINDVSGLLVKHYPDITKILENLYKENYIIAIASRTSEINGANQLIELFEWNKFITYREIYPGCKITHLKRIKEKSNIPFNQMIFFDDENRNIVDVNNLGVFSILVKNGVTKDVIKNALDEFSKRKK